MRVTLIDGKQVFAKEYQAWRSMKNRCTNPNSKDYENYGARGIEICAEWGDYEAFLRDMGPCPAGLQLDRIDNDKGYCKENCRWATKSAQMLNRRLFPSNRSGLTGVSFHKRLHRWYANCQEDGRQLTLYSGRDFFEACCARKSWEAKNV